MDALNCIFPLPVGTCYDCFWVEICWTYRQYSAIWYSRIELKNIEQILQHELTAFEMLRLVNWKLLPQTCMFCVWESLFICIGLCLGAPLPMSSSSTSSCLDVHWPCNAVAVSSSAHIVQLNRVMQYEHVFVCVCVYVIVCYALQECRVHPHRIYIVCVCPTVCWRRGSRTERHSYVFGMYK